MSKKMFYYRGRIPSFALPVMILLGILSLMFFIFFGAVVFLFLGAVGIGVAFYRKVFGSRVNRIQRHQKRNNTEDLITLKQEDYKVIDIED